MIGQVSLHDIDCALLPPLTLIWFTCVNVATFSHVVSAIVIAIIMKDTNPPSVLISMHTSDTHVLLRMDTRHVLHSTKDAQDYQCFVHWWLLVGSLSSSVNH